MTSVYSIGSGRQNKMFCLYHTFMEYRSYGSFERTHHVANLSTDYQKAVTKAKSIFKKYDDNNTKLVINQEWELNEIKRDGTSEQKNIYQFEPIKCEEEKQVFPLSQKVGVKGDKIHLNLGVTDAFSFKGRFGYCRGVKFVDSKHNEYITFSTSNFIRSLNVGNTVFCEATIKFHKADYDEDNNNIWITNLNNIKGDK